MYSAFTEEEIEEHGHWLAQQIYNMPFEIAMERAIDALRELVEIRFCEGPIGIMRGSKELTNESEIKYEN